MENIVYKDFKEAHYAMWDWIARQVKHDESFDEKLCTISTYKFVWLKENGYAPFAILHDCFACAVCEQNCNECPLEDTLEGCYDIWTNVVCKAFIDNDYTTAYKWAIKIRDGWK